MAVELVVPTVGESITEVQIGDWLVPEGQSANKDDALVVIETDKVTVELPAPVSGTVTKVLKKKGETAAVGEVIGYIDASVKAKSAAPEKSAAPAKSATSATSADGSRPRGPELAGRAAGNREHAGSARGTGSTPSSAGRGAEISSAATRGADGSESAEPKSVSAVKSGGDGVRVMPSAARALSQAGLSPADVEATGPGGRVLKEDVQRRIELGAKPLATPIAMPAETPGKSASGPGNREDEIVPMTPMRKRIAERLVSAQNTAALLTTFNEIDMAAVLALRAEHKDAFQARHGVKLGFMSFFVKAAIDALKLVPQMNAELRGDSIVYHNYFDIGVAVGGGKGLVVPVLRNAERMSFAEVETAIGELASRALANKLTLDELQGGTFTISNGGIYGSLLSTPIVNPPQSGILGLHAIQDRPVARDGQIVVRPMMYVAVTYDHRLVDGREAVTFLKRIKDCVENPSRMLLEI
jgi:2-oxoglutarate dehydrogenase E2 component (dihydrolipoamide succinyltransferase)